MFLHIKDFKQKCDACNFNSDEDKLKINNIKKQSFTHCFRFDKIIEHKESYNKFLYESILKCEIQRKKIEGDGPDGELFIQVVQYPVQETELRKDNAMKFKIGGVNVGKFFFLLPIKSLQS